MVLANPAYNTHTCEPKVIHRQARAHDTHVVWTPCSSIFRRRSTRVSCVFVYFCVCVYTCRYNVVCSLLYTVG